MRNTVLLLFYLISLTSCKLINKAIDGTIASTSPGLGPNSFSYATVPQYFNNGQAITPITPTANSGDASFAVTPSLPPGLSINTDTGQISGTPSNYFPKSIYTITAVKNGISEETEVTLSVAILLTVDSSVDASDSLAGDGICDDGGGTCTLRAAIEEANSLLDIPAEITVPGNTYPLNNSGLVIDSDLNIIGAGKGVTIIDGDVDSTPIEQGITINAGYVVSMSGFTVRDMLATTVSAGQQYAAGIHSEAKSLILDDCEITNNENDSSATGGLIYGAGLSAIGEVISVNDCTISNNTLRDLEVITSVAGAYLNATESLSFTNSIVTGNQAINLTGSFKSINGNSVGAVIASSDLLIDGSDFSNNTSSSSISGGAIVSGTGLIKNSSFDNNTGDPVFGLGGGALMIGDITADNIVANGNTAKYGSAISFKGSLTILNSSFNNNNTVGGFAGAIDTNLNGPTGSLTMRDSSIERGTGSGGILFIRWAFESLFERVYFNSGDIYFQDSGNAGVNARFVNSTLESVYISSTGNAMGYDLDFENVTFKNAYFQNATKPYNLKIKNSLLSSSIDNCGNLSLVTMLSEGHNISSDATCGLNHGSDLESTDPLYSALGAADNGGPTKTILLQPGSLARNAIDSSSCTSTDQRGLLRPGSTSGDTQCDLGAVEHQDGE